MFKKILVGIGLGVLLFGGVWSIVDYNLHSTQTITVDSKERICESSGECKYLVFTNNGVFENTDSLLRLKFDSSDLQGKLVAGETFKVTTYGWRVPILSWYKNIVKIEN